MSVECPFLDFAMLYNMSTKSHLIAYEQPYFERIRALIPDGSLIYFDQNLEGSLFYKGKLHFGYRVGSLRSLSILLHELGHFLDIDDARVVHSNWGLKTPFGTLGRLYGQSNSFRLTVRECSVVAWQTLLGRAVGFEDQEAETTLRALKGMPDWCLVPSYGDTFEENDESRYHWCRALVSEHLRKRSVDDALTELYRKISVLSLKAKEIT